MPDDQAPPPIPPLPRPAPGSGGDPNTWNMLCHLIALSGCVIPFGNIIGPLVIWLIKKDQIPSVDIHGKASLNFQITLTMVLLLGSAFAVMCWLTCVGVLISFVLGPLLALIALGGLVLTVIAAIKAANGENYRYPWSIAFLK